MYGYWASLIPGEVLADDVRKRTQGARAMARSAWFAGTVNTIDRPTGNERFAGMARLQGRRLMHRAPGGPKGPCVGQL